MTACSSTAIGLRRCLPGAAASVFLTVSLSCCCWPQLRRAIPVPVVSLGCNCWPSHQPPAACEGSGRAAAGLAMASFASCLVVGLSHTRFRLPILHPRLPPPRHNYPVSSLDSFLPFLRALSVELQHFCAPTLCGVVCNRSNLLNVILLL
jgi:hypothetical protein